MKEIIKKMSDSLSEADKVRLKIAAALLGILGIVVFCSLGAFWQFAFGSHPLVFENEVKSFTLTYGDAFAVSNLNTSVSDPGRGLFLRPGSYYTIEGIKENLIVQVAEDATCQNGALVSVWIEQSAAANEEFCALFGSVVVITPSYNTHWDNGEQLNGVYDNKLVTQIKIEKPAPSATPTSTTTTQ